MAEDYFQFVRRLRLKAHFSDQENRADQVYATSNDKSGLAWQKKNPNLYPEKIQNCRSESLLKFIDECLKDTRDALQDNSHRPYNKLTQDQRAVIRKPSHDKSIVIKPSDKCGPVVVMDPNEK